MTTTKKILALIACLALVLSSVGLLYADSYPLTDMLTVEYGDGVITYYADGFIFSGTGRSGTACFFSTAHSYVKGSVSVSLDSPATGSSRKVIQLGQASEISSFSFSNLVGCTQQSTDPILLFNDGTSTCSFDFEVTYITSSQTPRFYNGNTSSNNTYTATWSFLSLQLDDDVVYSSVVDEYIGLAIQPGYAFVIDGECNIYERSYYINNSWNFTTNENKRVNGSIERKLGSSSIRDGFSPDRLKPRSDLIQWEALNPNIFGKASNYEYYNGDLVSVGTGEVFLISYPTLYGFGTADSNITYQNSVNMICRIFLDYTDRPTFRYVALESLSEFSNTGSFSTYSVFRPDVADVEGGSSSGSGGTIITPDENLPTDGGNNGQPSVNDDNSQLGTISKLVNDIKGLFSNAVEGITELVNTGSSFMQSIGAMFAWLPSPVLSIIIAAFTVLLVVGVLKVLWR